MNHDLTFFSRFHRHPQSVGAILPSSRGLAKALIAPVDFDKASVIVELGPGTGPITAAIAGKLSGSTQYIGIEINGDFCVTLRARFPELTFVHDKAENIEAILHAAGISNGADAIICGLPWAIFSAEKQDLILNAIKRALRPGGIFVTYAYLPGFFLPGAWNLRHRLKMDFTSVQTTPVVWRNVPPAFAYICRQ